MVSAINLLPFYITMSKAEKCKELMRLNQGAQLLSFSSFFHKGALISGVQIAVISETGNHVAPSHLSDLSVPSSCFFHVFFLVSLYPTITSGGLFLLVSYDVLWPCSGSRTVTVLSLCHLIDTVLLVTCIHTMTINQVTDRTSPWPCAPAYSMSLVCYTKSAHTGNAPSCLCQTIIVVALICLFELHDLKWKVKEHQKNRTAVKHCNYDRWPWHLFHTDCCLLEQDFFCLSRLKSCCTQFLGYLTH